MEPDGGNNSEAGRRGSMGRGNAYDQESGHRWGGLALPAWKPLCVVRPLDLLSDRSLFLSDLLVVALGLRYSSTTCSISYLWFDMRCQIKRVIRREFFSFFSID